MLFRSTQFDGAVLLEAAGGMALTTNTVTINSTINTLAALNGGTVTITNSGLLTIAAAGDMTLDGIFLQNGAGGVSTGGDIVTTADNISFATGVTLTGNIALDTGALAGNIVFNSTVDGTTDFTEALTLTAGGGSITFTGAVGGTIDLGDVLVNSGLDVTALSGFNVNTISQAAGTGDTQFDGAVLLEAAGGMALTTNTVTINSTINTLAALNGGTVTITNAGLLDIASGADMTLDGIFLQNGAGGVSTGGDIVTTNDNIQFDGAVDLTGNVTLDSGALLGDIILNGEIGRAHV